MIFELSFKRRPRRVRPGAGVSPALQTSKGAVRLSWGCSGTHESSTDWRLGLDFELSFKRMPRWVQTEALRSGIGVSPAPTSRAPLHPSGTASFRRICTTGYDGSREPPSVTERSNREFIDYTTSMSTDEDPLRGLPFY